MKKLVNSAMAALLILWILPGTAVAAELLVPVGKVVGLELGEGTAVVAAFDDSLGSTARESGLQIGDEILQIDGKAVCSPEEIRDAVYKSLPYRLMAHTAEDLCEMCMTEHDRERCGHDDVRHGFAIYFPDTPPQIDIPALEAQVNAIIA